MPTQILMPALSPTMTDGTLSKWHVKVGDSVTSGDILAEIETDKAIMEFEAAEDGTVGKLLAAEGETGIAVNQPIAILLNERESASDLPESEPPDAPSHPPPNVAQIDPADSAPGLSPQKQEGGAAQTNGDSANAAESRKDAIPAPFSSSAESPDPKAALSAPALRGGNRILASPLARRLAQERHLDLSLIAGTGPGGRIVKQDIENAAQQSGAAEPAPARRDTLPQPRKGASWTEVAALLSGREYSEIPLDGMRKTIAARLVEAKQTIPHFYLRREIQIDEVLTLRAQLNDALKPKGIKISINDFIIKASALALQAVPDANSVWAHDRILRLQPSDVAVAVAIEGGLYTPVIRDSETKSLPAISQEMKALAEKARERRLKPEEYAGGSFSISNLGMFGIENFDAVINPPQGSILAVGAGRKVPAEAAGGSIEFRTKISVTLSCDHRVIDGALGAKFLGEIAQNLESPMLMLI